MNIPALATTIAMSVNILIRAKYLLQHHALFLTSFANILCFSSGFGVIHWVFFVGILGFLVVLKFTANIKFVFGLVTIVVSVG